VPQLAVDTEMTSGGGAGIKRKRLNPREKSRSREALAASPLFNTGEDSANPGEWEVAVENNAEMGQPVSRIATRPPETTKERKSGNWAAANLLSRPHKPFLDEMGPHAERPVPGGKEKPARPAPSMATLKPGKTIVVAEDGEPERRGKRRRPVKSGRPGA